MKLATTARDVSGPNSSQNVEPGNNQIGWVRRDTYPVQVKMRRGRIGSIQMNVRANLKLAERN